MTLTPRQRVVQTNVYQCAGCGACFGSSWEAMHHPCIGEADTTASPSAVQSPLILTFPDLPDMALSTNAKSALAHWAQRHKAVKADRRSWGQLFVAKRDEWTPWVQVNPPPYVLAWEVRFPTRRNRDQDGVLSALKHATDALVDVGLLPGDGNPILPEVRVWVVLGSADPGTTLTLLPLAWLRARKEKNGTSA